MAKQTARGGEKAKNKKYIFGRLNENYEGPSRAAQHDIDSSRSALSSEVTSIDAPAELSTLELADSSELFGPGEIANKPHIAELAKMQDSANAYFQADPSGYEKNQEALRDVMYQALSAEEGDDDIIEEIDDNLKDGMNLAVAINAVEYDVDEETEELDDDRGIRTVRTYKDHPLKREEITIQTQDNNGDVSHTFNVYNLGSMNAVVQKTTRYKDNGDENYSFYSAEVENANKEFYGSQNFAQGVGVRIDDTKRFREHDGKRFKADVNLSSFNTQREDNLDEVLEHAENIQKAVHHAQAIEFLTNSLYSK